MQSDNSLPPCVSSDAVDDAVTGRETGSHLENTGRGGRGKLPSHLMFNMPTRISRKKLIVVKSTPMACPNLQIGILASHWL